MITQIHATIRAKSGTYGPGDEERATEAAEAEGWNLESLAARGVLDFEVKPKRTRKTKDD